MQIRIREGIRKQGNTWCVIHNQVIVMAFAFDPAVKGDEIKAKVDAILKAYNNHTTKKG